MFIWRGYTRCLDTNPLITKSITSGTLVALGDTISQYIAINKDSTKQFDPMRTLKMSSLGFIYYGPSLHYWYKILERFVPGTSIAKVTAKTFLDQTIYASSLIFVFFTATGFMDGHSWDKIQEKQKEDFLPTLKANWSLWIPANIINFAFVPVPLRVLYISSVALIWNTILSGIIHKD